MKQPLLQNYSQEIKSFAGQEVFNQVPFFDWFTTERQTIAGQDYNVLKLSNYLDISTYGRLTYLGFKFQGWATVAINGFANWYLSFVWVFTNSEGVEQIVIPTELTSLYPNADINLELQVPLNPPNLNYSEDILSSINNYPSMAIRENLKNPTDIKNIRLVAYVHNTNGAGINESIVVNNKIVTGVVDSGVFQALTKMSIILKQSI